MISKKGIVAGSFDPITRGHFWLIKEALKLVDELWIVIGVNPTKKSYFSPIERKEMIEKILNQKIAQQEIKKIKVFFLENELLINFASNNKIDYIFRGIRNGEDFRYEHDVLMVNRKINQTIQTLYLIPPSQMTEVSSSVVKGLVGFKQWEDIARKYVHQVVVDAFKEKLTTKEDH